MTKTFNYFLIVVAIPPADFRMKHMKKSRRRKIFPQFFLNLECYLMPTGPTDREIIVKDFLLTLLS
jgi:hypothetical protein